MKELSLNILDIAYNSIAAKAATIKITVNYLISKNRLVIVIEDDGCGMSKEFVERVISPFTTTRTTRKVGLGIPFMKDSAEVTGGEFSIESEVGKGTAIRAEYVYDSIDRMPMGDLAETVTTLIGANESIRYILEYRVDDAEFVFDTLEAREVLGGDVRLDSIEVISFLKEYIAGGIFEANNGRAVE